MQVQFPFARQRAFPYCQHSPSLRIQSLSADYIAPPVFFDFPYPILDVGIWHSALGALMPMPEAAMYLNHSLVTREYYVWFTRKFLDMQPIAKPKPMQAAPDQELGLRVLAPDKRHYLAPPFDADGISQERPNHCLSLISYPVIRKRTTIRTCKLKPVKRLGLSAKHALTLSYNRISVRILARWSRAPAAHRFTIHHSAQGDIP